MATSRLLTTLRYYVIHNVAFSIFGLLCLSYLLLFPVIALSLLGPAGSFTKVHRTLCQHCFKFVLWFCRKVNFLNVTCIDEANGDYGPIIVANHVSMFDIVCILAYFRRCGTYVNAKFLYNPFLTVCVL